MFAMIFVDALEQIRADISFVNQLLAIAIFRFYTTRTALKSKEKSCISIYIIKKFAFLST
jgi:hypothetical protein